MNATEADDARMFTWLCAIAQPMAPHMDGTFQWRIPSHVLPRAKTLRESVRLALNQAMMNEALATGREPVKGA